MFRPQQARKKVGAAPKARDLKEGENMSEKDKEMLNKIKGLPAPLREKFVDRLDGAAMAVETIAASGSAGKGVKANGRDSIEPD